MRFELIILFLCLGAHSIYAQAPQKKLQAQRITSTIKIDGNLNEEAWKTADVATNFIEWRPNFGTPENKNNKTEVRILYDDYAMYIGGFCAEEKTDSISKELVGRDVVGVNDFVGVILDTYNDKINAFGFYVTPLGEQFDARYSNTNGEDGSWNAVWFSECSIVSGGWYFEIKIPYSALRFSKNIETWGLNITRRRSKSGKQLMWTPVNPKLNGFINQSGLLTDITNVKPPLRLSFLPYLSVYANHFPYSKSGERFRKDYSYPITGGMEAKWGINQDYTLDMTLIPDFGQVQSDRRVLNLSPFETKYQENRPFFTEGTELFNKGNLFYSRRMGSEPLHRWDVYNNLNTNEVVKDNPAETKLLNATKISGRNSKGLGLGFLNAVAKPMYATVLDTLKGNTRKERTGSLTNYNIFVVDKTLKNNSSISFINTNVLRSGSDYDANVSALVFDFNNKKNTWYLNGNLANSNIISAVNNSGYFHTINFGKGGGNFTFGIGQELANKRFDKNDMGISFMNDYIDHNSYQSYRWLKPTKWYNSLTINLNQYLSHRLSDQSLQTGNMNVNGRIQLKNLYNIGTLLYYNTPGNDFYEPRTAGYRFRKPAIKGFEWWIETNETKKYFTAFAINRHSYKINIENTNSAKGTWLYVSWRNRYRFSSKFSANANLSWNTSTNDIGFGGTDIGSHIYFDQRNRTTSENTVNLKYNFSKTQGISLGARHYWSNVKNVNTHLLTPDGNLHAQSSYTTNNSNYNFNIFNVDMVYFWQFAPGSFLNVVWKNAIDNVNPEVQKKYFYNLGKTLDSYQYNSISVKMIYYIDYLDLKKHIKKR